MLTPPSVSYLGLHLNQRYRLERLVGEGASSLVFAALDTRLERQVAVKVLKPRFDAKEQGYRKRFLDEGRMLAKLQHPNVVAVHDTGETPDGLAYLVMQLSEAGSLEQELERRATLPVVECLELLLPIMGALACAHDRGIVHRDLKPSNIVLVHAGDEVQAHLLDFGIAKQLEHDNTTTHAALGTPAYMAPEQARGEAVGPQADVWALGVVFFRCLSGMLPLVGSSPAATLLKIVQERAPRFERACPALPPTLAVTLDRALEPELGRRYADMRAFARALAMATVIDGLRVPTRPEPIGLPQFAAWLAEANVQSTERLEATRQATRAAGVLPPAVTSDRGPAHTAQVSGQPLRELPVLPPAVPMLATGSARASSRAKWLIGAVAMFGSSAVAWLLRDGTAGSQTARVVTPPSIATPQREAGTGVLPTAPTGVPSRIEPPIADVAPQAAPPDGAVLPLASPNLQRGQTQESARARGTRRRENAAKRDGAAPPSELGASNPPAKPPFVTTWDWK